MVSSALAAVALLLVSASLTVWLTTRTLEGRVQEELRHTSRLLGGSGFPLSDPALKRVAEYIEAEVVVLDAAGHLVASSQRLSLSPSDCALLAALPPGGAQVSRASLGGELLTVGAAPLPPGPALGARGGRLYVLYSGDLVAAEARRAWAPLLGVGAVGLLLAAGLGVWLERRVRAAQTAALVGLLASVAHEVRNPLGGIRTLASGLARRQPEGEREELELIASEAERLAHLADSLRAIGLPVRTQRRPCDPAEVVRSALRLCAGQLEHQRVRAQLDLGPPVVVQADPDQVRQVILNLVLNAADAQPLGGEVRLVGRVVAQRWELSVEDEGPGVDPALRRRLFEPFVSGKAKGLGVGLYLSRRLVEANGGALWLDAQAPGGRFVLAWPLAPSPLPEIAPWPASS